MVRLQRTLLDWLKRRLDRWAEQKETTFYYPVSDGELRKDFKGKKMSQHTVV